MSAPQLPGDLRRAVLAVSVLDGLDLLVRDDGVVLPATAPGAADVVVTWHDLARSFDGVARESTAIARARIAAMLRLRRFLADTPVEQVRARARALALPRGHALHPGLSWVQERFPGNALELGLGILVPLAPGEAEMLALVDPVLAGTVGIDVHGWWPQVRRQLEGAGHRAAQALAEVEPPRGVLRPLDGCDALTLLTSQAVRALLAGRDPLGMATVAAPMRDRAWFDLRHGDPAYVHAVWTLTPDVERGCRQPLLVTREEVALPRRQEPATERTPGRVGPPGPPAPRRPQRPPQA